MPPSANALGPFAKDALKLQGVWRQTASTLAVINNKVLAEGDTIQQFRVETIQQDVVWVVGPNGREKLEFTLPAPTPAEDEEPTSAEAAPAATGPTAEPATESPQ